MNLFKRFRQVRIVGRAEDTAHEPVPAPPGSGGFDLAVVGESTYLGTLREAKQALGRKRVLTVLVECEPRNRVDKNAVRVATVEGHTIGYLSTQDAAAYCGPISRVGGVVSCRGRLAGGEGEKINIGVWLDLCQPDMIGATP